MGYITNKSGKLFVGAIIIVLIFFIGYAEWQRTFANKKLNDITNIILPDSGDNLPYPTYDCGIDINFDAYKLNDLYFQDNTNLVFKLHINYYTNRNLISDAEDAEKAPTLPKIEIDTAENSALTNLNTKHINKNLLQQLKDSTVITTVSITKPLIKEKKDNTQALYVDTLLYNKAYFIKRVAQLNAFYKNSNVNIEFELSSIDFHLDMPESNKVVRTKLAELEKFLEKERKDLRSYYHILHIDWWHKVFGKENHLNLHVFNDFKSSTPGRAGGIGSVYSGVRTPYLAAEYRTVEHEIGHQLGLYHTHQYDPAHDSFSNVSGDEVCDTPKSFPLAGLVDDHCALVANYRELREQIQIRVNNISNNIKDFEKLSATDIDVLTKNVMSYTRHQCRTEFTPGQKARMRKLIETNVDLRRTVKGMEVGLKAEFFSKLVEYADE